MSSPNPDAEPDDLPDADVEARWSDIVARLDDVEQVGRTSESTSDATSTAVPSADDAVTEPPVGARRPSGPRDWETTPEVEALEEADSHFVPPVPEPVAHRDPLLALAWTVVVAVPVLTILGIVLLAAFDAIRVPSWVGPAAGGAFIVAIAVLVWRMPQDRDPEDGDRGAVV